MPNYDAGHYFLTLLAPVRLDSILIDGQSHSRRHLIREVLANMPTGERTVASRGGDNPFARATSTHFARFVVLDDVVFNGRVSGDSLLDRIQQVDPLTPQPVDRLSTPYLVFATDFDAAGGDDGALKSHLAELWATMQAEIVEIFQHCIGFEGVRTADDFFRYVKKCQVETTMPFNDYWSVPLNAPDLDLKPYLFGAAGALVAAIIAKIAGLSWGLVLLLLLLALAIDVFLVYRKVMDTGQAPFPKSPPPAPGPDLPTVLKSLYLQRAFVDLAIGAQGQGDQALYDAFGRFIAEHQPTMIAAPTQKPGVIGA